MKNWLVILSSATLFMGCRDKKVLCTDIGNKLKEWTVYNPGDTLVFKDQLGNESTLVMAHYDNRPSYYGIEKGGLLKKQLNCHGSLVMSTGTSYFSVSIDSESFERGEVRNPTEYHFQLNLGDAFTNFLVNKQSALFVAYSEDLYTSLQINYVSGSETYPEALVYEKDSSDANVNVYRLVYAKEKGLVEYSTKAPQRTWKLQ